MSKLIERWHHMISINSIYGNEKKLAEYISGELKAMGIESKFLYFDDDTEFNSPTVFAEVHGDKPGKRILLTGHMDTVGIGDGWTKNPFIPTVEGDRTYGRGSMDMKGGLAALLETVEYYQTHKEELEGTLVLAFLSDEEYLSRGVYRFIDEKVSADVGLMAENRYDNVAVGFRGRLVIDVEVRGKAVHSKDYPMKGKNAIIMAMKLGAAIEALPTKEYAPGIVGSWCLKNISGGMGAGLIVPPSCKMDFDRFTVKGETEDEILKQVEELIVSLGMKDCATVQIRARSLPYMQPFAIDVHDPAVVALQQIYKEVDGKELRLVHDPSCCDSNIIARYMPSMPILTFGPSGENMHGDDEYGYQWQVENCAEIYRKWVKKVMR